MLEFEKIYHEYYDHVYKYIYRLSGDGAIAEEIAVYYTQNNGKEYI